MRRHRAAVATVGILGALAACTSSTGESEQLDGTSLDGRSFTSTEVDGRELIPGTRVTLSFTDGGFSAQAAGCNTLTAHDVTVVEGRLRIPDRAMSTTEMSCPGQQDQERWLWDLLDSAPTIRLDGDSLVIDDGDARLTLEQD